MCSGRQIFFYFNLNLGHLGGSKKCEEKKFMRKALSIHDQMALVSGL